MTRTDVTHAASRPRPDSIPRWVKIGYTLYLCVMVPTYWSQYGPANFLWFCDVAALVTGAALWLQSPLLASMEALAMTLPQIPWICDFLSGGRLLGISRYMFSSGIPLFVRGISTFHLWLPFLLIWLVWRLGYDRRAFWVQSAVATALLLICFMLTNPASPPVGYPDPAVNVNRVYGPTGNHVQTWMPLTLYLLLQIVFYSACVYLPAHLMFRRVFRHARLYNSRPHQMVPAPTSCEKADSRA